MIDYYPDGKIDCRDYAIRNSIVVERMGYDPKWNFTKNHVFISYEHDGSIYVLDGDRVFVIRGYGVSK